MNILFIYPTLLTPKRGGIERVSDLLCREFVKRGHTVIYLHNFPDKALMDYQYPAPIFYFRKTNMDYEAGLFYREILIANNIDIVINQDPSFYYLLYDYIQDLKVYTISVVHSNPLYHYNRLFKETMSLRNHTIQEKLKRIVRFFIYPKIKYDNFHRFRNLYNNIFSHTDLICLLSDKFIPELSLVHEIEKGKVIAINNPNTYSEVVESVPIKKNKLLYVGRIERNQKRTDRLLYIWKRLYKQFPQWELVIVGDGSIKREMEAKSATLERITFTGLKDPKDDIKEAAILCLTSDFEGWGMVLTEAMTYGTIPVCFHSFASVTDIIENSKNGILITPYSLNLYISELKKLMNNNNKRIIMAQNCIKSVRKFNVKYITSQWEIVFDKLMNNE